LTQYGPGRSANAIHTAIVNPDLNQDVMTQLATLVTKKGTKLKGLVRAQDNFFVVLQTEDGAFHTFTKSHIIHLDYSGHSLMPQSYGTDLNGKELDDLIAYLSKTESVRE